MAYTYNDPVIWAEYVIDIARAARRRGIKNVLVTAGYVTDEARPELYADADAANVDLKAFSEDFYRKTTASHLEPVLETLKWIRHESNTWLEVTTLLIPGHNDSDDELTRLAGLVRGQPGAGRAAALHGVPSRLQDDRRAAHAARDAAPRPRPSRAPPACATSTSATCTTRTDRRRTARAARAR